MENKPKNNYYGHKKGRPQNKPGGQPAARRDENSAVSVGKIAGNSAGNTSAPPANQSSPARGNSGGRNNPPKSGGNSRHNRRRKPNYPKTPKINQSPLHDPPAERETAGNESLPTTQKTRGYARRESTGLPGRQIRQIPTGEKNEPGDTRPFPVFEDFGEEYRDGEPPAADLPVKTGAPDFEAFDFDPPAPATLEERGVKVVGVRFKHTGKVYYFAPGDITVCRGDHAIVETARGPEYGEVSLPNTYVKESDIVPPLRPLLRLATPEDTQHNEDNRRKEKEAFSLCVEKIARHGLDMKLVDAQYTFDNAKLLFYFTAAGRVDFRELVKDLASVFRTRIELRQIGIRDEAKLLGGLGACGRPLCCSTFLSDFTQVSIKMAKEQNLSLNSNKISGACGRLMCCLRYEHDTYVDEIRRTPPVDSLVRTADGDGVVTEINPLSGSVKVRLSDKQDTPAKFYYRDDVKLLSRPQGGERGASDKGDKA